MAERLFFTGSVNIISDPRPSGLDLRVYACISLHDGMSLHKGTGRGCYASFATLTAELGCDAANLSRSLKRLVEWGYLAEERQDDRRRRTYRVVFESRESWQSRQQSAPQEVGNSDNVPREIVGNGVRGNGSFPPQGDQHYIPLKELDFPRREKLDSDESVLGEAETSTDIEAQLKAIERDIAVGSLTDRVASFRFCTVDCQRSPDHRAKAWAAALAIQDMMTDAEKAFVASC